MRKSHLRYLVDPVTQKKLRLQIFKSDHTRVYDGLLLCGRSWYPIIDGIPRLLTGQNKLDLIKEKSDFFQKYKKNLPETDLIGSHTAFETHQFFTATSFSYEWKNIYQENDFERNNFLHFLSPFINQHYFKNKLVLDIGCGSGRFTKQAALLGAKLAVGSDLGQSVEVAFNLTKHLPNVCIVQADIYSLPFNPVFDLAYSIGVLHHLPRPESGFKKCLSVVKPRGKLIIWVYNRRHNNRALYIYEPLRSLTRILPKPFLYKLCYFPALLVHLINLITAHSSNPPFGYYRNFPFNMKLNDAFDVLATPKSNYYYVEQIIEWFEHAHLKTIRAFEHPEAGITCIGSI
jgi:SAM-dependent methyltransferase